MSARRTPSQTVPRPITPAPQGEAKAPGRSRRRRASRVGARLAGSDRFAGGLPPLGTDEFYATVVEYHAFMTRFSADADFREQAVKLWLRSTDPEPKPYADVIMQLWSKKHGFRRFDRTWLSFLDDPPLEPVGRLVWSYATADPVMSGLWRDIVFTARSDDREKERPGRLLDYCLRLAAGEAPNPWITARRDDAMLLLYLFIYPMCVRDRPPDSWPSPYDDIRDQFPTTIADAWNDASATRIASAFVSACTGGWLGQVKIMQRASRAVAFAVERGWLRAAERAGGTSSWLDPRTDPSVEAAACRERWLRESAAELAANDGEVP